MTLLCDRLHEQATTICVSDPEPREPILITRPINNMRLFVALEPSEDVRSAILEVVEELSAIHKNARWVKPENLHFTLKFLDEVESSKLYDVMAAIEKSARAFQPFRLNVHGLGYFGRKRSANVVWVGCHEGRDDLLDLVRELEANLSKFRKEEREHSPHLTLCRCSGNTERLIDGVEKMKQRDFGAMEVRSVVLKKSDLTPRGAVYENIKVFPFVVYFVSL